MILVLRWTALGTLIQDSGYSFRSMKQRLRGFGESSWPVRRTPRNRRNVCCADSTRQAQGPPPSGPKTRPLSNGRRGRARRARLPCALNALFACSGNKSGRSPSHPRRGRPSPIGVLSYAIGRYPRAEQAFGERSPSARVGEAKAIAEALRDLGSVEMAKGTTREQRTLPRRARAPRGSGRGRAA